MKHRSKTEKRKLRKNRSKKRAVTHYEGKARKSGNGTISGNKSESSKPKRYVSEELLFIEDIFKLREMSEGGLQYWQLSIINSARIHTVGELVLRMREKNFKVKGIGKTTKEQIQSTLREYGVHVPV